ncbi:hypothetical protein B0H66DRAFT_518337 [Apodospora peruviana]|uniref:F-box domain-containing protein n=1 Tax=Apodospora peruviana TaxID=516989 RepID=A0AAE0M1N1_9PEZI|nr:hypothetical protein B0H66DRAFT_518337 [Apodospora peruviana]
MASLSTLPTELLCLIISNLDPIALIALSQTSQSFRSFIKPERHHFVQRLLALELQPEHGGIVPLMRTVDNNLTPPMESDEWRRNKYACAGCMKLLTHLMFDNHSILRLGLRKPPPGSEQADKLTDWEPVDDKVAAIQRAHTREATKRERLQPWRRRFIRALRQYARGQGGQMGIGPDAFTRTGEEVRRRQLADIAEAEMYLCGISRHKRMCNECRMQRGDWARHTSSNVGSATVPIVRSRALPFQDEFARWFPNLLDDQVPPLAENERPRPFRVWNFDKRGIVAPTYVMRCRGCAAWQEIAAFRVRRDWFSGGRSMVWEGNLVRCLCSHCFAKKHGQAKLAEALLNCVLTEAGNELRRIQYRLGHGWRIVISDFDAEVGRLRSWQAARNEILGGHRLLLMSPMRGDTLANERDRKELQRRLYRLRRLLMDEVDQRARNEVLQSWYRLWMEDYDLNQASFFRMLDIIAKIKENPQLLVDYALHPDRFRFETASWLS